MKFAPETSETAEIVYNNKNNNNNIIMYFTAILLTTKLPRLVTLQ